MDLINWIATNIFGVPAIMLGSIVMLGLMLQKKSMDKVITGTFKAIIGFLIIGAGSNVIVGALVVFEPMWAEVFNLESSALGSFMGQEEFNATYGSAITLAMTLGFLINVILARFTRFKYIYLTGHMMFWTTTIIGGVVVHFVSDITVGQLTLFLSIFMGLYWTFQPAITQPFMRKVTGNDSVALGHTSASVAIMGSLLGKWFGNKENDTEKLKLSGNLGFLRDSNVVTALTMGILFVIGAVILMARNTAGADEIIAMANGQNFIIYAIVQSFTFAGGIAIVLLGVRMFIGEMVPAFKGIATKVVPGAIPALDCPVVYSYAPNAVILGFVGAFVGGIFWMLILGNTVGYVFVPTMIVLFFHGATAGVFGNSTGGVRGAVLGGFATATVVAWGQYFMITFLCSSTIPDTAMWAADSDMFILAPIAAFLATLFF